MAQTVKLDEVRAAALARVPSGTPGALVAEARPGRTRRCRPLAHRPETRSRARVGHPAATPLLSGEDPIRRTPRFPTSKAPAAFTVPSSRDRCTRDRDSVTQPWTGGGGLEVSPHAPPRKVSAQPHDAVAPLPGDRSRLAVPRSEEPESRRHRPPRWAQTPPYTQATQTVVGSVIGVHIRSVSIASRGRAKPLKSAALVVPVMLASRPWWLIAS